MVKKKNFLSTIKKMIKILTFNTLFYYCLGYKVSPEIKEVTDKTVKMKRITMALVDND